MAASTTAGAQPERKASAQRVTLIVSDDHAGLRATRAAVFPSIP